LRLFLNNGFDFFVNDYKKLFEEEIGYDVIIYAGEEPNVKEIHAHSNILCYPIKKVCAKSVPNGLIIQHLFEICTKN
jgi:hypothetical protein